MNALIIKSAIKYPDGEIVTARRHWEVIRLQALLNKSSVGAEQGFVDHTGKFYTREEARELCLKNGQLSKDHKGTLYSEDLWPEAVLI